MNSRIACWLALALVGLSATTAVALEPNWGDWAESARKGHPLAGDYYAVTPLVGGPGHGRYPPGHQGPALRKDPEQRPYVVLLGEVHDNADHHQVRAWLIANTAKMHPDWHPAIVFEQIRAERQDTLDTFNAQVQAGDPTATADELLRLLNWDKSGWPPAQIYKPLFVAAIAAKLPIYAGDPPRDALRSVAKGDMGLLPPEERTRLRLDRELPEPLRAALGKELAESHCGALPPQAADGMVAAQRYHDARLADAVLAAAERHGSAILIAGNGHVRSDRGVPWHIRERAPQAKVASIMLLEVEADKTDPDTYVPRDPEGDPAVDVVIFTPRAERDDPCQSFLKKKG
ncbi:MAG: ChaN family lipoprotein [Hyphomicrobiaceae bacterium]|nr:ChaN family lipoprotein [Hyphomicrobiaceae bacterium]